jgi:hypothetical protein
MEPPLRSAWDPKASAAEAPKQTHASAATERLPRAVQLLPVTGIPPVREARAGEAFINDFRVPPSLVAEHRRVPVPMQRRHGNLITPLLMIGSAVAVLIAYFSVGNLVSRSDSDRAPKLASLDSTRIIAPPLMAAAEQNLRPNEERDSAAATPPDHEISSQSAIIPPVETTETAAEAGFPQTLSAREFSTATGTTSAIPGLDSVHQVLPESSATAALDLKDTKPDIGAESQPPAFTCYPSAPAVRQDHPNAWPSWTLRAPSHEGTRCWYATTRAAAHEHRTELPPTR